MRIITIYDSQYREVLAQDNAGRLTSIITHATDAVGALAGVGVAYTAEEIRDTWTSEAIASDDADQIAWARSVKVDIHDLDALASTDHAGALADAY